MAYNPSYKHFQLLQGRSNTLTGACAPPLRNQQGENITCVEFSVTLPIKKKRSGLF